MSSARIDFVPSHLSFSEFVDFILVRLYELGDSPSGHLHDVRQLATELRDPVPEGWPADAVTVLENRGFVLGALAMQGSAEATIRGEGRLYVESRTHDTNVIDEYREHPANVVIVSGTGHQVAVGVGGDVSQYQLADGAREDVLEILSLIAETLQSDQSIGDPERAEHLADVEATRSQLARREPNIKAAISLLEPLASLAAISELVLSALKLLGVG